jgi:hypothetical protein
MISARTARIDDNLGRGTDGSNPLPSSGESGANLTPPIRRGGGATGATRYLPVTVFTKNRERLIAGDIAAQFMAAVLNQERVKTLLSDDHFSVDGTLIEAWASMKSFRRKDGSGELPAPGRNGERDFHGEKRRNETHASTTDPDARLYRKGRGQPAKLAYLGHILMENRHALVVDARLTLATGTAERAGIG